MLKRPKNQSDIPGIFYSGGTVFPGGGIPLCMSSGKIVSEVIQNFS
jgi:phytoene dehydrogenase-like protein